MNGFSAKELEKLAGWGMTYPHHCRYERHRSCQGKFGSFLQGHE